MLLSTDMAVCITASKNFPLCMQSHRSGRMLQQIDQCSALQFFYFGHRLCKEFSRRDLRDKTHVRPIVGELAVLSSY